MPFLPRLREIEVFLVGILNRLLATKRLWSLPSGRLGPAAAIRYMSFGGDGFVTSNYSGYLNSLRHWDSVWDGVPSAIRLGIKDDFRYRAYLTAQLARMASRLDGDFVELGTHYGVLPMHYLLDTAQITSGNRRVWLCDVWGDAGDFSAHPDMPTGAGAYQVDIYDLVKSRFAAFEAVQLVRGYVPESLDALSGRKIAYLSIDLNSSEPERASLERLWPQIVPGGIVYFDDIGDINYSALRATVEEFVRLHDQTLLYSPSGQGYLIKS